MAAIGGSCPLLNLDLTAGSSCLLFLLCRSLGNDCATVMASIALFRHWRLLISNSLRWPYWAVFEGAVSGNQKGRCKLRMTLLLPRTRHAAGKADTMGGLCTGLYMQHSAHGSLPGWASILLVRNKRTPLRSRACPTEWTITPAHAAPSWQHGGCLAGLTGTSCPPGTYRRASNFRIGRTWEIADTYLVLQNIFRSGRLKGPGY